MVVCYGSHQKLTALHTFCPVSAKFPKYMLFSWLIVRREGVMKEIQKRKRGGYIRGWVSGGGWKEKREEKEEKRKKKNETKKRKRGKGGLALLRHLTFFWVLIYLHRVSLLLSLSLSQPLGHLASLSKFLFILFTFFVPSHVSGFQSAGTSG